MQLRSLSRPAVLVRQRAVLEAYLVVLLALATAVVLVVTALLYLRTAHGYIDNGDGYYLYASQRIAAGATLYRQVMGTQPPLIYLWGATLFKLGASLEVVRLASVFCRVAIVLLVAGVARRLCWPRLEGTLAALLAALLPQGLYWTRSFDVNPLLTLVSLFSFWLLLGRSRWSLYGAGVCAATALATKNLFLPVLLALLVHLLVQRREALLPFLLAFLGTIVLWGGGLLLCCGPHALVDAYLGQGSSPLNLDWFTVSLLHLLSDDGIVIMTALVGGAVLCAELRRDSSGAALTSGALLWYALGSAAILGATVKEGTAWPIFQIAEPAMALLAAHAGVTLWQRATRAREKLLISLLGAFVLLLISSTALGEAAAIGELDSTQVTHLSDLIQQYAPVGSTIIAPPYYALLTNTRLPDDEADTYIFVQRVSHGERQAVAVLQEMVANIRQRRYPVVLIDSRLAQLQPVMDALRRHYRREYSDSLPPALHSDLWLPVPSTSQR